MSVVAGLDGLLDPLSRCLDAESARRVAEFQIAAPVQARIAELAEVRHADAEAHRGHPAACTLTGIPE